MSRLIATTAMASLLVLGACSKESASPASSDPTVTVTTVDEAPTIIQEETITAPETVDGPAMDSIDEAMPPATQKAKKK